MGVDDDLRDARRLLSGATARRDVMAQQDPVVRAAAVRWPQLGGELLLALPAAARDAALVAEVVGALTARGGEGDDVLVRQLRGEFTVPGVDIDELVSVRAGDGGGWLDRGTGEVTPDEVSDALGLDVSAEDLVHVPGEGSGAGEGAGEHIADPTRWQRLREGHAVLPVAPDVRPSLRVTAACQPRSGSALGRPSPAAATTTVNGCTHLHWPVRDLAAGRRRP